MTPWFESSMLATILTGFVIALIVFASDTHAEENPTSKTPAVTVTWSAPTTRQDGSALSLDELGGYDIRYQRDGDNQVTEIQVNDPSITTWTIENLPAGKYQFSVLAFDTQGLYSPPSDSVSIDVPSSQVGPSKPSILDIIIEWLTAFWDRITGKTTVRVS